MRLDFDLPALRSRLERLSPEKRLAFLLSCAERMVPNYREFHRRYQWGQPEVIRQALDLVWAALQGVGSRDQLQELRAQCDRATPDTEDFDTILVSSALDAAATACLLLDLLDGGNLGQVMEGAALARDTVDMYVQELEDMDANDADLEERILGHPLMQQELRRQREDVELLERLDLSSPAVVADLERRWRNPPRSSLDLPG
jgi:uncharacterized protein